MAPRLSYPGVYVQDAPPQGARPIVGVATSIVAMVLDLPRGPQDVPIRVNRTTFGAIFGADSLEWPHSLLVDQFFANGGSELFVIRAPRTGSSEENEPKAATLTIGDWAFTAGRTLPGRDSGSRDPGIWGTRLRLESRPAEGGTFTLRVIEESEANPAAPVSRARPIEEFAALTPGSVSKRVGAESQLIFVESAGSETVPLTGTYAPKPVAVTADGEISARITVDAGTSDSVDVKINAEENASASEVARLLQREIRRTAAEESLDRSEEPTPKDAFRYLTGAEVTAVDGRLYVTASVFPGYNSELTVKIDEDTTNQLGFDPESDPGPHPEPGPVRYAPEGGSDGDQAPGTSEIIGNAVDGTGIYALDTIDLFNVLCLPGLADQAAAVANMAYEKAATYCDQRRAMIIMDMPKQVDNPTKAEVWARSAPTHNNSAVYFPRLRFRTTDAENLPAEITLPNSAAMAGLYSRTDAARGVWKAPAGLEADIRLTSDLAYRVNDGENGVLNPLGVNALRVFPVNGRVSWGARTRSGADTLADQFKYIPVRRTAYFLAESLYRGTQWAVFEPNDEPLWSQLRLSVGAFMNQQFRKGAFQGTTAREAYLVKCDAETTTQADVDRGIVNVVVGFAPLKPAEFVFVEIRQLTREGA